MLGKPRILSLSSTYLINSINMRLSTHVGSSMYLFVICVPLSCYIFVLYSTAE